MTPAFRSTRSIVAFVAVIVALLVLPFLLLAVGPPSREQAWSAMPTRAGAVGDVVRAIYRDRADGDVVVVGSSLVRRGIDFDLLQQSLSARLERPTLVEALVLNWPGTDVQYAMLRDYLDRHQARVILWNPPAVATPWNEAHIQAYRWYRLGDDREVVDGLPFASRMQLYAEAVFGAPKQLLLKIRPSRLDPAELGDREGEDTRAALKTGYQGAPFIPDAAAAGDAPAAALIDAGAPPIRIEGREPSVYEMLFAQSIVALAQSHHCRIYLLHVPTDDEFDSAVIPEVMDWSAVTGTSLQELAIPTAVLFKGMDRARFLHFFSDRHLNLNGRALFTRSLLPEVSRLLDPS